MFEQIIANKAMDIVLVSDSEITQYNFDYPCLQGSRKTALINSP